MPTTLDTRLCCGTEGGTGPNLTPTKRQLRKYPAEGIYEAIPSVARSMVAVHLAKNVLGLVQRRIAIQICKELNCITASRSEGLWSDSRYGRIECKMSEHCIALYKVEGKRYVACNWQAILLCFRSHVN